MITVRYKDTGIVLPFLAIIPQTSGRHAREIPDPCAETLRLQELRDKDPAEYDRRVELRRARGRRHYANRKINDPAWYEGRLRYNRDRRRKRIDPWGDRLG